MATRDRTRAAALDGTTGRPADSRYAGDRGFESGYRSAPRYDWRDEIASASGLNVLAGVWLIVSPFVLDYAGADAVWNPIVFGAIVAVFALARLGGAYRAAWLSVANMAIGVWLFISAFWLAESTRASWNVAILGVIVFVLGSWSAAATRDAFMGTRRR